MRETLIILVQPDHITITVASVIGMISNVAIILKICRIKSAKLLSLGYFAFQAAMLFVGANYALAHNDEVMAMFMRTNMGLLLLLYITAVHYGAQAIAASFIIVVMFSVSVTFGQDSLFIGSLYLQLAPLNAIVSVFQLYKMETEGEQEGTVGAVAFTWALLHHVALMMVIYYSWQELLAVQVLYCSISLVIQTLIVHRYCMIDFARYRLVMSRPIIPRNVAVCGLITLAVIQYASLPEITYGMVFNYPNTY